MAKPPLQESPLRSRYLQGDETPVRFLEPGHGRTKTGYLWTLHRPGGNVFYQLHPGRGQACLNDLLGDFSGSSDKVRFFRWLASSSV